MTNKNKIALIGGDIRQLYCGSALNENGYETALFGFDTYESSVPLSEAVKDAAALIFPVPVMKGDYLNLPLSNDKLSLSVLMSSLPDADGKVLAAGGMISPEMKTALEEKGYTVFDLCENETFNYLNAIPTAEGAVSLAMSHTKITLNGSGCLVIGYGRIGRVLSRMLKALGAAVTVVARKEKDRTEAESEGMAARDYKYLPSVCSSADVIFNTVPAVVLENDALSKVRKDVPVIELASKPGGVDTVSALKYGTRVISAQSLPGRVAPVTAGRVIARCIRSVLEGGLL